MSLLPTPLEKRGAPGYSSHARMALRGSADGGQGSESTGHDTQIPIHPSTSKHTHSLTDPSTRSLKQARIHAHTHTHTHTDIPTHTHGHAQSDTHTHIHPQLDTVVRQEGSSVEHAKGGKIPVRAVGTQEPALSSGPANTHAPTHTDKPVTVQSAGAPLGYIVFRCPNQNFSSKNGLPALWHSFMISWG